MIVDRVCRLNINDGVRNLNNDMYLIHPYKSIGQLRLNSSSEEIENFLGKSDIQRDSSSEYVTKLYGDGTTVSYKDNLACFIGIIPNSAIIIHSDFNFTRDVKFEDVLQY